MRRSTALLVGLVAMSAITAAAVEACGGKTADRGGLMVEIVTDGTFSPDQLSFDVSAQGSSILSNKCRVPSECKLPNTIAIVSNGDPTASAAITVIAYVGGRAVDRRDIIVSQIPTDRVVAKRIVLSANCSRRVEPTSGSALCPTGKTCDPHTGDCVDSAVSVADAGVYVDGDELDSGPASSTDASDDAEADATPPTDATAATDATLDSVGSDAADAVSDSTAADATDACTPESKSTTCAKVQCGTTTNNCGASVDCGTTACTGVDSCGGGGTPNKCGCTDEALTTTCSGGRCGAQTNNCGHSVTCAATACTVPESCGGGGTPNKCGGCNWTPTYPPAAGCPDHVWACFTPTTTSRTLGGASGGVDYTILNLCGDGVVVDKNTGLMWAQNEEAGTYPFANAGPQCASSRRGGFSDWRVPTPNELITLIDYKRLSSPAMDISSFQGPTPGSLPTSGNIWTSSPVAVSTGRSYVVSVVEGGVFDWANSGLNGVRCVR